MEHCTEACKNLNNGKLYQVSIDGPNVNLKFLRLLKEQIGSGVLHELIDIGSCNLHSISNGFKIGAELTQWDLPDLLRESFVYSMIPLHEGRTMRR